MDCAIKITFSGFIAGVFLASVFSLDYSHVALAVLIAAGLLALSFYGKEKSMTVETEEKAAERAKETEGAIK